jgi:hypothetical protein
MHEPLLNGRLNALTSWLEAYQGKQAQVSDEELGMFEARWARGRWQVWAMRPRERHWAPIALSRDDAASVECALTCMHGMVHAGHLYL